MRPAHAHYKLNKFRKLWFQESIKERVENLFFKRLMLGTYIICTCLHFFNRKTKKVLVFAIHYILSSVLFIHFIPFRNKYDVWYIVVLIDYLRGIHMTIPFQIIQRWIGKYEFYNHPILWLKKTCLGVASQSTKFCYTTTRPNFIFAREHIRNKMVQ